MRDMQADRQGVGSAPTRPGAPLPAHFDSVQALEDFLVRPSAALIDDLAQVEGDIMILGVAGKMGPTLARLARNAAPNKRILGVARFSDPAIRQQLEAAGVETITADLLDRASIEALPRVANVIFAAGHKFGAKDNQPLTWAMNTHVPALVADTLRSARIVAFSTGNVYPLSPVGSAGADENTAPAPVGEYAQSCLGRERMLSYFSSRHGNAGRLFRLNYAIDMRYGVLHDIASRLHRQEVIDVTMGHVNVIWQGDANAQVLRCLRHCTTPSTPINCTGPETLSVRWLASELAQRMGTVARFTGQEAPTALLSNTALASGLFGYPQVPLAAMLDWTAHWVRSDKPALGKPTKFEVRDGTF